jgi:hypothetical protein
VVRWRSQQFGELGFEVGDALVEEAVVLACAGEALPQSLLVGGKLTYLNFEAGVFGDDPLEGSFRQVVLEVADLAEKLGDACALDTDLALGCLQGILSIECTFSPGGLCAAATVGDPGMRSACAGGLLDQGSGLLVLIEEGA